MHVDNGLGLTATTTELLQKKGSRYVEDRYSSRERANSAKAESNIDIFPAKANETRTPFN